MEASQSKIINWYSKYYWLLVKEAAEGYEAHCVVCKNFDKRNTFAQGTKICRDGLLIAHEHSFSHKRAEKLYQIYLSFYYRFYE
jgi:hypothetical protein